MNLLRWKGKLLSLIAIAVLVIIAYERREDGQHDLPLVERPQRSPLDLESRSSADEVETAVAKTPDRASSLAPAIEKSKLATDFENSANFRAFLDQLLRNEVDGRSLYAMSILASCRNVKVSQELRLSQPSDSNQQLKAKELMQARCSDFTDDEISGDRQFAITRDPRIKDDRFKSILNRWSQAQTDPAAREQVIKEVLDSGDPMLMETVSTIFFRTGSQSGFFNGEELSQPFSRQVLTSAWTAAVCEATATACGVEDRYVTDACASRNACYSSRYDLMYQTTAQESGPEAAALFKQVYPSLVNAIEKKDTSVFRLK